MKIELTLFILRPLNWIFSDNNTEGKLFLFHQQPPMRSEASATEHEDNLIVALEAAGFVILDRLQKEMSPAPSACIVSERLR